MFTQRTVVAEETVMRNLLLCALVIQAVPGDVVAETIGLVCENARREYRVYFDSELNTVRAESTFYRVLVVEKAEEKLMEVGLTVNDGPTFRLHIRPYKKMEYFSESQLFQTDECR